MQKLFKRSLATVLAVMMVVSMFAGSITVSAEEAYTKYAGTNTPMFHIASVGAADLNAPNALDMQYLAQEFVPDTTTISGAKLNINLTSGSVVMHVELRKGSVTAAPFFGTDVTLNSVGDRQDSFYTLSFGQNVEVEPGAVYYLAFWMKSKSSEGIVVIAQGGVSEGHDVYRHKRFSSDGTKYEPETAQFKATGNAMGFEILPGVPVTEGEVVFFDDFMPHHAADRGKWEKDTNNFTTGDFAYRALADFRSGDKLSNSRLYRDDPVDITGLYNENGEFYLTFDFYADPDYVGKAAHYNNDNELVETKDFGLENVRLHVMLYSKGDVNAAAGEPKQAKQAIEITRWERGNANANETNDWNMFGLENGLQPGWNRMAVKLTDKDGVLSYAKAGNEASWDPTKMWGINFAMRLASWQDKYDQHGTVETVFDNFKFMSVEAYEERVATIDYNYQFRNCDSTGWQNTPRGEFYPDTATYTEGEGSIRTALDWRSGSKLMNAWLGSIDNRANNNDTLDISKAIDKNGDFYITFDLWADPEYTTEAKNYDETTGEVANVLNTGLNEGRLVVGLATRGEGQTGTSMDNAAISMEFIKAKGTDWTSFGLENGLQPGWNHIAIKANANTLKSGGEAAWDPSKLWGVKFNYDQLNWKDPKEAHGTVEIRFDDLRFMSVAAYEADFARVNAAKAAIAAIAEVKDADDTAGIEKATKAYNAVPANAKYLVTNYEKMTKLGLAVNKSIYTVDGVDCGMGWIMVPAGAQDNKPYPTTPSPWTEQFTEGTGAGKVQWANTSNPVVHLSIMGVDKTWDLSEAEYITFDFYVHGWSVKKTGDTDFNFGFGEAKDPGSWGSQNLGWAGKDVIWEAGIKDLKEGWNHLVLPIPVGARKSAVGNMRLFFEKSVVFNVAEGDKPYAIIDDIRAVNAKGLKEVEALYAAKDVVTGIQAMETVEDVKALRVAYDALDDAQKAYVFNADALTAMENDILAGETVDTAFAALEDKTFAGKAAIDAVYAQYAALSDSAKAYATCANALEALKAEMDAKQAALDAANVKLAAIPAIDALQLMDKFVIDAAYNAYTALADDVKPFAVGADVIEAAYAKIDELYAAASPEELAAFVDQTILDLPSANVVTLDDAELVASVVETYEALGEAKALVSKEATSKLYALRVVLAALQADADAAAAVDAAIAALNATLTLEDKDAVYAAADAYAALNDNAKAQVANKAALDAAVAAMDKLVADDEAFKALDAAIKALGDDASVEEIQAVVDLYNAANADVIGALDKETAAKYVAAKAKLVNMGAYEVQFRSFDKQKADYNCNYGGVFVGKSTGTYGAYPAVGTGFMGGKTSKEEGELHHYIYAYNQNHDDTAEGTNLDGTVKFLVDDPKALYVSFDLYVSDASVINAVAGDCGFGIDAESSDPNVVIGTFQAWGSTFVAKRSVVTPVLKEVKDGWNHIILPLDLVKNSAYDLIAGTEITLRTMRFYTTGVKLPAGFVSAVDDVRVMNKAAAEEIFPARTAAKVVTDMIRAYPAEATAEDFYAVYLAYNAVADEYKDLIIGWDAFMEANADKKAAADEALAADKAAADVVIAKIAALDKEITVDDKAAIDEAKAALEALTANQKVLVTNQYILPKADAAYEAAVKAAADKAAADAVIALIDALPETVSDTDVTNTDIAAAREAYDALTDDQKAMVGDKLAKLEAAEANLVIAIDMDAAAKVQALIDALPTPTDVYEDDVAAINAAAEAYGKLTAEQKAYLAEGAAEKLAACVEAAMDPKPLVELGDANGDGAIDAKDALAVLRMTVGKEDKNAAADVNKDGNVNATDALEILKYVVGKPSALDK